MKLISRSSSLLHCTYISAFKPNHHVCIYTLQETPFSSLCVSSICRHFSVNSKGHSFTVCYLIGSCGLSPESALRIDKKLKFETPEKPDTILNVLKSFGFSKTQIAEVVKKSPSVLLMNPEKTLLPKLNFFTEKGLSGLELARVISAYPLILKSSLENSIIPKFECLRSVFRTDGRTMKVVRKYMGMLDHHADTCLAPNIQILKDNGATQASIALLLSNNPRSFLLRPDMFEKSVEEFKEMGFEPSKTTFAIAMSAKVFKNEFAWKRKLDAYKKWGWSDEVILNTFRKYPWIMLISDEKIMAVMDFFVNRMGLDSLVIAKHPYLLSKSLEKRLIPRALVYQYLTSTGFAKKKVSLIRICRCTENEFLNKFVNFHDQAPQLLKIYYGK